MKEYGLIHFKSTHQALEAEIYLEDTDFQTKIIPTPGSVAQGCGFSIRYPLSQEMAIHEFLSSIPMTHQGFYHIIENGYEKIYQRVDLKEG